MSKPPAIRGASLLLLMLCSLGMSACSDEKNDSLPVSDFSSAGASRWYTAEQAIAGQTVFAVNCASCHGEEAQGIVADWRQRLDDGSFPPPPLNGSAHAWHHPTSVLLQVINDGGQAFGGKMPAFRELLTEPEKLAAIAYFQQFWSDEVYGQWEQMGGPG